MAPRHSQALFLLKNKLGLFFGINRLQNPIRAAYALVLALGFLIYAFIPGPLGSLPYNPVVHQIARFEDVRSNWRWNNESLLRFGTREFKGQVLGPESIAFDLQGRGPYTGVGDGRIVRWMGPSVGWETFAFTSPHWNPKHCGHRRTRVNNEHICGRPLGLRFDKKTGNLFIADSYRGLLMVGPQGGLARQLVAEYDGKPIIFANDLDIHTNGSIYFTDSSTRWNRRLHHMIILEGESSGRLLRYDMESKVTTVVIEGLAFANGVQISKDGSFLLVVETTNCRILRYWLEGPLAGKKEVFVDLPGYADNVRLNENGDFWVAIDCCRNKVQEFLSYRPWIKTILFRLPVPYKLLLKTIGERMYAIAALFNSEGELLRTLEDKTGQVVKLVSEVEEREGKIWFGTVVHSYIATFMLNDAN